jgi:hypothetical protein
LIRCPATYNGTFDSRARQPADALTNVDRNIPEHLFNANISRSSCLHPLAKIRRHHPLTKSLWKKRGKTGATKSDKRRQRTCRNMTPFAVSSDAHSGSDEGNETIFRQTSSLNTALGHDRSRKCCAKLAQKSRERFTQLNTIQHRSTSAVHAAGIVRPSHTQDKRKGAAKSRN